MTAQAPISPITDPTPRRLAPDGFVDALGVGLTGTVGPLAEVELDRAGAAASETSKPDTAANTLICSFAPVPFGSTKAPLAQWKPHWRPLEPPVHCLTAAWAEERRTGRRVLEMKGASWAVKASDR